MDRKFKEKIKYQTAIFGLIFGFFTGMIFMILGFIEQQIILIIMGTLLITLGVISYAILFEFI